MRALHGWRPSSWAAKLHSPPEMQQAIAAARAAGQTIAATPTSMVFMNDGAEPGSGELDCPTCGGSGHAAGVVARSTP